MDLYDLGAVDWKESQGLYHALAELGREGLIICYPASPYVCLGLHDDLAQEIDLAFCQYRKIPLLRRETGGGVVYLDSRQVFYQLVLHRDNPLLPLRRTRFYTRFLRPAISVCRSLGMPAELKEPADLAAGGRKCSGNACGDIGPCTAYVGNLLLDFDYETMSGVLRAPDPDFRGMLCRAMRDNMTTLADWRQDQAEYARLASGLAEGFAREIGALEPRGVDDELRTAACRAGERLTAPEWLHMPGRRTCRRRVKIAEGVYLAEKRTDDGKNCCVLEREGRNSGRVGGENDADGQSDAG